MSTHIRSVKLDARTIVMLLIVVVIVPFSPLLISLDWGWWEAWAFGAIGAVGFVASRVITSRAHPDLLEERAKSMEHEDTAPFDKVLAPLMGLGGLVVPIVAGIDTHFGEPLAFPLAIKLAALAVFAGGYAFGTWAMVTNKFFSGTVRIQQERGHRVVDTGPYRAMRHPGYAGAFVTYPATAILLDSLWALVPAALFTLVLVVRTHLEDRFLRENLDGYAEFAKKTRFRLIPGIW